MTYQAEKREANQISGQFEAPQPTESEFYNVGDATPLVHNMIKDYVDILELQRRTSRKTDPARHAELTEYLAKRHQEIADYIKFSAGEHSLPEDRPLLNRSQGDMDEYAVRYVDREVSTERIERTKKAAVQAIKSFFRPSAPETQPAHISVERQSELTRETVDFIDVVKGGLKGTAKQLRKIAEGNVIHSNEINVTAPLDERELLNDPQYAAEVTLSIHQITPEDVGIHRS